jgi:cyclic beta-1,2-glucan synthetase
MPALRSVFQSGCDGAHRPGECDHAQATAGMESCRATRIANSRTDLASSWRTMWFAPVLAAAGDLSGVGAKPAALGVAGPILGLWFASPAIAWWISRPLGSPETRLTADQTLFLRRSFPAKPGRSSRPSSARKIIGCRRTTIRSIPSRGRASHVADQHGLALLANLSAYDFGYISAGQLIERTANALHTMKPWSATKATSTTGTTPNL